MGKEWDQPGAFVERKPMRSVRFDRIGGNHNPVSPQDAARTHAVENRRCQVWHTRWLIEAFRVLQSGGEARVFGGTRTFHRLAVAMEFAGFADVGFESWAYGSGFPKSLDVSKVLDRIGGVEREVLAAWAGWGTALKPAWEPILVGRKPS